MIGRSCGVVSFLLNGLLLLGCAQIPAPELEPIAQAAPAGIAEALRRELVPTGTRVLRAGRPLIDLWFRNALPTTEPRNGKGILYGPLIPGSLIGVARIHDGASDFKGQKIAPGLYTLRYAVQPDDGDHFEVSESRDFLLLCEAAADTAPGDLDAKTLQKLSARINGKKHPSVLYLTSGKGGARSGVVTAQDPGRVVLDVEVPGSGGKSIGLAIVVAGKAE
jgi:hypothetical protein